jgi:hypothetical protein
MRGKRPIWALFPAEDGESEIVGDAEAPRIPKAKALPGGAGEGDG